MSKLKFILLFFVLISIISVALLKTTRAQQHILEMNEMFDPSFMAPITILSLIFVAVSFLLSHYMSDHDGYTGRLSKLKHYCMSYKTSDELCDYISKNKIANDTKNDKEIINKKPFNFTTP
jgi:hypothetical protein